MTVEGEVVLNNFTNVEREKFYMELCSLMGETKPVPRMWFCDLMMNALGIDYSIIPQNLESWLKMKKGVYVGEDESLAEAIERKYGKRAAELAQLLV